MKNLSDNILILIRNPNNCVFSNIQSKFCYFCLKKEICIYKKEISHDAARRDKELTEALKVLIIIIIINK